MNLLALLTVLLSAVDHWTTYLCLREPVADLRVSEANPIADWLFSQVGLIPGLLLDSALTLAAVLFLLGTRHVPPAAKALTLGAIAAWTGYAVVHNLGAMAALGLSPLGAT
ncbi:MAG: hypothetical protein V3U03_09080 [Myxococcota bacterium]